MLEGENLYGTHDELRTLFKIPKLVIKKGLKLAVVGANGCGKSTLLTALAGKQQLAGGQITLMPGARIVMVDQSTEYDPDMTVGDVVLMNAASPKANAARRYRSAVVSGDSDDMQAALQAMDETDAWVWEANAIKVMHELGLTDELQGRKIGALSGGEERRVALAAALVDLESTDMLILDEPTNHLSTEGCDMLQELLQEQTDLSVVLVTHDRYFLDEVCDEILEIDGMGAAYQHPGGWNTFLSRRAERFAKRTGEVESAKVQLKAAEEWMKRGPSGRRSKNMAQQKAFHETKGKAMATIAADDNAPDLGGKWMGGKGFSDKSAGRTGGSSANLGLLSILNATVEVRGGLTIFEGVSFSFSRGMKVGICGPNGAGKSTFLKALAGEVELKYGKLVEGDGLVVGYLAQEPPEWPDPRQKVLDAVSEMANDAVYNEDSPGPSVTREAAAAQLLKTVNFPEERWYTQVESLSGGERRRLQLLKVLATKPNVLLLDEPTNDLDAVTVDSLERLLQNWPGTLIVVSHDRSLLDGVCNTHLVFTKEEGMRVWTGSHKDLRVQMRKQAMATARAAAAAAAPAIAAADGAGASGPSESKVDLKAQRQSEKALKKVENGIEKVEKKLEKLAEDLQLASEGLNTKKIMELAEQQQELEAQQEALYEEWETLSASA